TLQMTEPQARRATFLWIWLAIAGLALGVAQMAAPAGGAVYLYRTTNAGSLVGLFANRNHEAAMLVALLPLGAALVNPPARGRGARRSADRRSAAWIAGLCIVLSIVALGVIRSRAGVFLALPAVL